MQLLSLKYERFRNLAQVELVPGPRTTVAVLRLREGDLRVFSFNTVPHLEDASMRTHR